MTGLPEPSDATCACGPGDACSAEACKGTPSAASVFLPELLYDFNMPPKRDGTYAVSRRGYAALLHAGQRVIFGCRNDELMAEGVIVGFRGDSQVYVRKEKWLDA